MAAATLTTQIVGLPLLPGVDNFPAEAGRRPLPPTQRRQEAYQIRQQAARSDFRGPKTNGKVTPATLFRGITAGDLVGPYLSQFLLKQAQYPLHKEIRRHGWTASTRPPPCWCIALITILELVFVPGRLLCTALALNQTTRDWHAHVSP